MELSVPLALLLIPIVSVATIKANVLNVLWDTMSIVNLDAQLNPLVIYPLVIPAIQIIVLYVLLAIITLLLHLILNPVHLPLHALKLGKFLMEAIVNVMLAILIMETPVLHAHQIVLLVLLQVLVLLVPVSTISLMDFVQFALIIALLVPITHFVPSVIVDFH